MSNQIPDIKHVLSSTALYKQSFDEGLIRILHYKTAGTFILACANLLQEPATLEKHKHQLHEVCTNIFEQYRACQCEGRQPDDSQDDVSVINSLFEIGLENLDTVQNRKISSGSITFVLNYNQLRSFKPMRMSKASHVQLNTPFNQDGFHFNKPFLKKEIFAEGEIEGRQISCLYNKFPVMSYHAMLVLDREQNKSQFVHLQDLNYIKSLQESAQQGLPEFIIAYNSLGAGASVNHLHFHTILSTTFPVFSKKYQHNGGDLPYPAYCEVFDDTNAAWQLVNECHKHNIAYNLLFANNLIYCLPRKMPDRTFKNFDVSTYGWSHMAGFFNVDSSDALQTTHVDQLIETLQSISLRS